eukprot:scaffold1921_cov384-Pinguiococcus_pyrenoidosus.AAC.2
MSVPVTPTLAPLLIALRVRMIAASIVPSTQSDGFDTSGQCPSAAAWFDRATAVDTAHALMECANAGLCNREQVAERLVESRLSVFVGPGSHSVALLSPWLGSL